MRKLIATAAAAVMLASGLGIAGANGHGNGNGHGPPFNNPEHPAWYGLCTAYRNMPEDSPAKNAPPFEALENLAEEGFDEDEDGDAIDQFCNNRTPGNSGNQNAGPPGQQGNRG